jgi:hypothetical protein
VDSSLNEIFLNNLTQVSAEQNLFVDAQIDKFEIVSILKDMDPSKSPGSDGLSSLFYIKFFQFFGDILVCQE